MWCAGPATFIGLGAGAANLELVYVAVRVQTSNACETEACPSSQ